MAGQIHREFRRITTKFVCKTIGFADAQEPNYAGSIRVDEFRVARTSNNAHMLSSELEIAATAPSTFWETAADTRWGNYLTQIEREMLLAANDSFPRPGIGLEIGCEGGRWCRMLTDFGWQMTATDIDPQALALCQQRNPTVRCVLAHIDDCGLPAATASVDLLLCLEVPPLADQ